LRVELGAGEVDVDAIRQTADGAAANGEGERSSRKLALVAPQLRRVSFGKERYLEDVSAHVEHDGNGWRLIDVAGKTPGKTAGQFELKLTPTSGGSGRLAARADDVGSLFRILGVTTELQGGRLSATGQTAAGGGAPLQVQVEMRDYEFLRSSLLTKLLTLASGRGFAKFRTDDAIAFDYLGGEVAFADGRASTELIRTHGPALGLTVKGWVDTGDQKMELDGAVVPAYAANRVLGKIPLLGGLLSGDGKEGFWAIRYAMRGNPRDPKMEVHTLTSLTPAFLRDMFGKLE
jgi:hypothetical protein